MAVSGRPVFTGLHVDAEGLLLQCATVTSRTSPTRPSSASLTQTRSRQGSSSPPPPSRPRPTLGKIRAPAAPHGPAQRIARLSRAEVLERISRAKHQREELDAELAMLIDHAVALGIFWPQIAKRLRVTRQAARRQHKRRHREDTRQEEDHGNTFPDMQPQISASPAAVRHQVDSNEETGPKCWRSRKRWVGALTSGNSRRSRC